MDVFEFHRRLRETGSFRTESPRRPLPPFLGGLAYHLGMARIYAKGYRLSAHPDFRERKWAPLSFEVIRLIERCGGQIAFEGFEHVRDLDGSSAVVAANHVSALETYLIPSILLAWHDIAYVLKDSLTRYPVLGRCVRAIRPIPITRRSPVADLRAVLRHGTEALDEGRFVVLFPQGSRHRLFNPAQFNTIGTKLARHARRPVLPLCLATDFLRIGSWQRDLFATVHPRSVVRFACGAPIPWDLSEEEMQRRQTDFISSTLARWEKEDNRRMLAPPQSAAPAPDARR